MFIDFANAYALPRQLQVGAGPRLWQKGHLLPPDRPLNVPENPTRRALAGAHGDNTFERTSLPRPRHRSVPERRRTI